MIANGGEETLSKETLEDVYPSPINSIRITGRMECQYHVLWELGLVMAIMVNSPQGPGPATGVSNYGGVSFFTPEGGDRRAPFLGARWGSVRAGGELHT